MGGPGLMVRARKGGFGATTPWVYTIHRPNCTRMGASAVPLADQPDPAAILRRARIGLHALSKPCGYCMPDLG
jgi:hypothetical protein